jgi:GTP-binding protein YchF
MVMFSEVVGIVGLPNVGKSTLFNALLKKQQAYAANFPFATIEPNIGIVPVPEERLATLSETIKESEGLSSLPPEVPATVEFVDIAGLVEGAHKGEGLGNKFLSHIREVSAICHVVRNFSNPDIIREGSKTPQEDLSIIETELMMADLATLEKQREPKGAASKEDIARWEAVKKVKDGIQKAVPARDIVFSSDEERKAIKELSLLTAKPILVVLNSAEEDLKKAEMIEKEHAEKLNLSIDQCIVICAKVEEELTSLSPEEANEYLKSLGVEKSGLERLIQKAFKTLGLQTFLTAGEKEVRAWTIENESTALLASGVIHTDFMKKFIKADVVSFQDFVTYGGWKKCREEGKVRSEGKEYKMKDGDVVEFKIGA